MHEDFKQYKIDPELAENFDIHQVQKIVPSELWDKIDVIATKETSEVIELVIEGIARIVQDREAHPEMLRAKMLERRAKNIEGHQYAATADIHIIHESHSD